MSRQYEISPQLSLANDDRIPQLLSGREQSFVQAKVKGNVACEP